MLSLEDLNPYGFAGLPASRIAGHHIVAFNPFSTPLQPLPLKMLMQSRRRTMGRKLGVALIAARPAFKAIVQHVPGISDIYFVDELGPFSARVLLDFPTTWSFR